MGERASSLLERQDGHRALLSFEHRDAAFELGRSLSTRTPSESNFRPEDSWEVDLTHKQL